MVKARDVNKDIKAIAQKVKTAVFSYDEIHNENIKNVFHYDYELVINRVAETNGWNREETIKQLKVHDILSPLPNGEYKVEVGTSTKGGGGLNYHGLAFFTLSQDDYCTKYHELAHSLQKEYKLFNEQKVDKLYHVSAQGIQDDKIDDKQIDEYNYKLYLNEMHSECFAYAAMMLRAENPIDFFRQAYNAYNTGRMSNMTGFFSFGKTTYGGDNNNTKFYSTFPVMKETIKTIRKMRKMGKTKDFFDENGVLKDEKLAKLCEQIVVKSAYSPRTLNSFFKYRVLDEHNDHEHGWRKDTLKGIASVAYSPFIMLANEGNIFSKFKSMLKHQNMEMNEKEKIRQMTMPRRTFEDQETQALYDFIQYSQKCSSIASQYKSDYVTSDRLISYCSSVLREDDKKIHEPSIRDQARIILSESSKRKQEKLGNEMIALATFVKNQKDNPYFCHLIENRVELTDVIKMYNEKLKHPEKAQIESPTPIKTYQKKENEWSAYNGVRRPLFTVKDFAEDTKCSNTFKQTLVNLCFKDCETIDNPQVRKALAQSVQFKFDVFGIRKRKFTKKLNRTLDSISMEVHGQRNNLSYERIKKQYEWKSLEDILDDTKEKMQEFNKKKQTAKEEKQEETQDQKPTINSTAIDNVINNNLEAANYLADRYGLSDKLRLQLQKMTVMPTEKQENQELRKAFADVVHFEGDWLGKEKRSFKKDLDQLMYGFVCDAYKSDKPEYQSAYQTACRQKMEELQQGTTKSVPTNAQENIDETKNTAHQQATEKVKVIEKEEPFLSNDDITIFGKKYPRHAAYSGLNGNYCVSYANYLPSFFKEQKHFSSEEYQAKVEQLYPQFKIEGDQKAPSEKDIERYFINMPRLGGIDGATSVPELEEKLGIKIGGGYKYPKGMTDIEYHAYTLSQIGMYDPFHEPNPSNSKEAYMCAWQEMHYPRDKMLPILQQQYQELVELNPQLKEVKLDTNNPIDLSLFRDGVNYNFPAADINRFIAEYGKDHLYQSRYEKIKKELQEIGVSPDIEPRWILSSETIKKIGEQLKEKSLETIPEKTPKEKVIDKLKSWGIEDGTYLILTPEDNAFKSFGTNETRSVQSYFEEGQKDIKDTGAAVVYGTNNGLVGAYFAEGVYVVSNNDKMRDELYRKGKDVGFGVLLSNGERFNHEDGTANTELNAAWKLAHRKAEKANEKAEKAAQERKALKEQQTVVKIDINEENGAQKVCAMLQKISEVADRNDTSGQLKDKLVKAYVENSEQMLTLEFWGDCAKAFADRSPQKKSAFVQELGQLGLEIGKDIKQNKDDTQYQAVKKRCADCEKTDDVIKTATACAKRTHTSVNGSLDKAASR